MRIAVFSECYRPVVNGVVASIDALRDGLQARGHTVYVVAPGNYSDMSVSPDAILSSSVLSERPSEAEEGIFRLPMLPFPRHPFPLARPFPRLNFDFGELGVDLVHCQHPFTVGQLGASLAERHGVPMVYTAHSLYDRMAESSRFAVVRSVGGAWTRGVVRRFCARAATVIVPGERTREALVAAGVRARFAVIPTGVPKLIPTVGGAERIRAEMGVAEGVPLLLCVGRLAPEKRVDLLLAVVRELRRRDLPAPLNGFKLAIVGDGQIRRELEAQAGAANMRDRVVFVGTRPRAEMADWYAASDLFVLPSPAETQGLVLIEAMQMGVPCVAIAEGGPTEILTDGVTGTLVPFAVQPFANAAERLLCEPLLRQRYVTSARLKAADYTPERMAEAVLGVYYGV